MSSNLNSFRKFRMVLDSFMADDPLKVRFNRADFMAKNVILWDYNFLTNFEKTFLELRL